MAKVSPYVFVLECVIKKHELMYTKNTSFCKLKHEYRKAWSGLSVLDRELYFQKLVSSPNPVAIYILSVFPQTLPVRLKHDCLHVKIRAGNLETPARVSQILKVSK